MSGRVYLDWNATAPLRPEAHAAMIAAMDLVGNPSSVHAEGRAAKAIVEKARAQVAALAGCEPSEVIFTSGATEAATLAMSCIAPSSGMLRDKVLSTSVLSCEHDCIFAHRDLEIPIDRTGHPDLASSGGPEQFGIQSALYAVQSANSETGILQDVATFSGSLRTHIQAPLHVLSDVAQSIGRLALNFRTLGADTSIVSGHKLGAPKGVGALVAKTGVELRTPIKGGGQEMGRRSGTENVVGIAGFGAAAEAAKRDLANGEWDRVAEMRDAMEAMLLDAAPELVVFGREVPRLPNTSNFAIPGWKGETQVMQMDLAGIAVSAGSACSSGKVKESRVLRAMGYDGVTASSAIRVSMGPSTKQAEVTYFADTWIEHYRRFRARAA